MAVTNLRRRRPTSHRSRAGKKTSSWFCGRSLIVVGRIGCNSLIMLTENQKIGAGLIGLGLGFIILGIVLLCDTKLIAIGNALFMVGLVFAMGIERLKALFMRLRGTICFFIGILLVLFRWGIVGMIFEIFGFVNLFANFFPTVLMVARQLPGLSTLLSIPIVSKMADRLAGKGGLPKYSA